MIPLLNSAENIHGKLHTHHVTNPYSIISIRSSTWLQCADTALAKLAISWLVSIQWTMRSEKLAAVESGLPLCPSLSGHKSLTDWQEKRGTYLITEENSYGSFIQCRDMQPQSLIGDYQNRRRMPTTKRLHKARCQNKSRTHTVRSGVPGVHNSRRWLWETLTKGTVISE